MPSAPDVLASSLGRVQVAPHSKPMPWGGQRTYGGAPTFGAWIEKDRRFAWHLRGKNYKIARLVCEAFHGPPPDPRSVCMHLDENSRNNRPENLAWGTQKENLNAPGFLDYCRGRTGENNPRVKGDARKATA